MLHPKPIKRSGGGNRRSYNGKMAFEHWYIDNQVYFITARVRDRQPAFESESAKAIFWDRFDHYTQQHGFEPWVTSLLDNHYHTLGYLKIGTHLGEMMRRLHGSVAKLVNDVNEHTSFGRIRPFWRQGAHHDYFDGAIRDETQARRAYRYTLIQSVRHGVTRSPDEYAHTRVRVTLNDALRSASQRRAYLTGVPYPRYERGGHST